MQRLKALAQTFREWWLDRSALSREIIGFAAVVIVVAGAGGIAWRLAREPYREWQKSRAILEARQRAETGDHRGALLAFRRATQLSPGDIETWREVAEYLAGVGSGEILLARQNLVRLAPEDTALRVALIIEALKQGDTSEADTHLNILAPQAREDAAFHRLAAALALMLGKKSELESHLEALVALSPDDRAARHNLAALRLWGADKADADAARKILLALLSDPDWRVRSALELLKYAAASGSPTQADRTVAELLRALDPGGVDQALASAEPGEPPGWSALLSALRDAAAPRPEDAAAFAVWWSSLGQTDAAEQWLGGLDTETRESAPILSVRAGLLAQHRDTSRLDALLAAGAWGPVKREVLSLAMAARLQARAGARGRAEGTWSDAVATAGLSAPDLRILARLAAAWSESTWSPLALWPLAEHHPRDRWALDALRVLLAARGDVEGLWRLYSLWAPRAPDDLSVQSTWIMLAALLDRLTPAMEATSARWRTRPTPSSALALVAVDWRRGRTDAARAGLEQLEAELGSSPKFALWDGLVALQAGDLAEAERVLGPIQPTGWLDPELRLLQAGRLKIRDARRAEETKKEQNARVEPPAQTP